MDAGRDLSREIYIQDLVLALYGVYVKRLRDARGRDLLSAYIAAERDRGRRLERAMQPTGARPVAAVRRLFAAAGGIYGRLTSRFGSRIMLRIALSASGRAARRACDRLEGAGAPEAQYLAALRARNEGELLDSLRQHLIDTAPRRR